MRKLMLVMMLTGATGCVPASDAALCLGLGADVAALRTALVAHPETPDPVGDPASLVVIGFEAGCRVLR